MLLGAKFITLYFMVWGDFVGGSISQKILRLKKILSYLLTLISFMLLLLHRTKEAVGTFRTSSWYEQSFFLFKAFSWSILRFVYFWGYCLQDYMCYGGSCFPSSSAIFNFAFNWIYIFLFFEFFDFYGFLNTLFVLRTLYFTMQSNNPSDRSQFSFFLIFLLFCGK